jgi:hypothetical protein
MASLARPQWWRAWTCRRRGHQWATSIPSRWHCLNVACLRCGGYKTIHMFYVGHGCQHVGIEGGTLAGAQTTGIMPLNPYHL